VDLGRDEAVGLFRQTPLFAGPAEAAVAQLAAGATLRRVRAGEWLFRQGDAGEHIYVVVSGRLEAIVESSRPDQVVRVHGRGELIGELAFITGWARSASVRARRDAELLEIPYTGFRDLVRRHTDDAVESCTFWPADWRPERSHPPVPSHAPWPSSTCASAKPYPSSVPWPMPSGTGSRPSAGPIAGQQPSPAASSMSSSGRTTRWCSPPPSLIRRTG